VGVFRVYKLPHLDHRELLGVEPGSKKKAEAVKKSSLTAYCFIDLKLFSHLRKLYLLNMNFPIVQTIRYIKQSKSKIQSYFFNNFSFSITFLY
jgi:hypothetical protein